jgi:hypothetical protein
MTTRQRPHWTLLATLCAAFLIAGSVMAQGKKAPNPNNGRGKITAVSATSITVTPKNGSAKTYTINANTKITLDGQPATATDLTTDQHANIKSADGTVADKIKAHTKKAKGGKHEPITPATSL